MMRNRWVTSLLVVLLLGLGVGLTAHSTAAQGATGTLKGRVIQADGTAVVGATITAHSDASETSAELGRTTTGANGVWQMTVPAGQVVWIHFNTFGPWWGYSYSPPFTLQAGQVADQIEFVLAARAVAEVPTPAPTATALPPTPAPTATALPPAPTPTPLPVPPVGMPNTGSGNGLAWPVGSAAGALLLLLAGSRFRRRTRLRR